MDADKFAEEFRALCQRHSQECIVLVYQDPDSADSRIVCGPSAGAKFLGVAMDAIRIKAGQRRDRD